MAGETSPGAFETIDAPASGTRDNVPKSPFWDFAPTVDGKDQDVYVQFNPNRVTSWERVTLGGIDLPGVCQVRSAGRLRRVDVANAPADDTSTVIDSGATAAEVQINVTIWTPAHLARWETFMEMARDWFASANDAAAAAAKTGTRIDTTALDVVHPGLNLAGVTSLYLRQVGVLAPGGVRGTYEAMILAVEYDHRPAPKKKQAVKPVDTSLDGLDKKTVAKELQPKTPSQTQAGP